jgi:hypothetical protein
MKALLFIIWIFAATTPVLSQTVPLARRAGPDSARIHGTITDDHQNTVGGARVVVRALDTTFADSTVSDSAGRYTVRLPEPRPAGSFLVIVTAAGFAPSRAVVDSTTNTYDVTLASPATALAAVRVVETRERPSIPQPLASDVGGLGTAASGSAGNLAPASYGGDVLGFAAGSAALDIRKSASGHVDGITTIGLGPDQTGISMDGADVRGIQIPRDARVAARTATSVYDPSQGGFSGARVDIATSPGANIGYAFGSLSGAVNASSRVPSSTITGSGTAFGHLVLDRVMYSSSAEFSHTSEPLTAFGSDARASSAQLSLSPADASALRSGLGGFGVSALRPSSTEVTNSFSTLNRIDLVSDSDHTIALTARLSADADSPYASSPTAIGDLFGDEKSIDGGLSLLRTAVSDRFAQETSVSLDDAADWRTPFRSLPLLQIQIPGQLNGIESAGNVLAGSLESAPSASRRVSIAARHIVRWVTPDGHHKSDAGLSLRVVHQTLDPTSNLLGTVSFDSIGALTTGSASAYSRVINPVRSSANVATLSGFVGDLWILRPRLSVQGGIRFDLNQFSVPGGRANTGMTNAALNLNSTTLGRSLDASPRLGVTWDIPASGTKVAAYSVRAGVGRFVNDARGDALVAASLPFVGAGSPRRLVCTADNTPDIDWQDLAETNLPASCSDGTLPGAENVPGFLIARDWKPPASWRGNIGGTIRLQQPWTISADFTHSVTTRMSSALAANLAPASVFTLASESNRPVYTNAGALANAAVFGYIPTARLRNDLGTVSYLMSDMRLEGNQLAFSLQYHPIGATFVHLEYAYTDTRELTRGLDGTTSGDPRVPEWSPVASPSHVVAFTAFRRFAQVSMIIQGRVQSGMHYTPFVAGDVNGDGVFDDRAYVAAPGDADASLANGIQELVAAPAGARDCLERALGGIARRNSCVGPWTASLDASLFTTLGPATLKHRPSLHVDLLNVVSGLDEALHGVDRMRGWGGNGRPDNILMTSTGFDASTGRFGYVVNPAFGSVRANSQIENPFAVRVSILVPFGPDGVAQQLAIDASRRLHPSVDNLTDRYVAEYPNVGFYVLDDADSVGLDKSQRDSLAAIGRQFDATLRGIWRPVAQRISDGLASDVATRLIKAARTPSAINYEAFAVAVRGVLNASQFVRLPADDKWIIRPDALTTMGLAP